MIFKVNDFVYLVKNKCTFKEQQFLDNGRLVYCLVAVEDGAVHGLLQSSYRPSLDEKDEVIKEYLKNKRRLINFDYTDAKELVEITSYKVGNK